MRRLFFYAGIFFVVIAIEQLTFVKNVFHMVRQKLQLKQQVTCNADYVLELQRKVRWLLFLVGIYTVKPAIKLKAFVHCVIRVVRHPNVNCAEQTHMYM